MGFRIVLIFLCIVLGAPEAATARSPAAVDRQKQIQQSATNEVDSVGENADFAIDVEKAELRRRNAILEAKADISDDAYARFEIIIGVFGASLAVMVFWFGLSTREAAVAAARKGIEEDRTLVRNIFAEIEGLKGEIAAVAQIVRAQYNEMEEQAAAIGERIIRASAFQEIGSFNPGIDLTDRVFLSSISLGILDRPVRDRTTRQFYVIIAECISRQDWGVLLGLAMQLRSVHGDAPESLARSLFYEALAVAHSQSSDDALARCEEVLDQCRDPEEIVILRHVSRSHILKAIIFKYVAQEEDEIGTYREVVEAYSPHRDDPEINDVVAWAESQLAMSL